MFLPIGDDVDNRSLPIAGTLLIATCVLVFILQIRILFFEQPKGASARQVAVAAEKFYKTWGLVPRDLTVGKFEGLITYQFLHGGLLHLVGNMVVLWALAASLENHLGGPKFLGLYLLWGAAGGLAHAAMNWGQTMPLVGASGAIAGMIGAYFVAYGGLTKIKTLYWFFGFRTMKIPTAIYVFLWFMSQVASAGESTPGEAGVAWYCHIGGFLAGMVTMFPIRHHTAKQLVLGHDGELYFALNPEQETIEEESVEPPTACPYCDRPITAEIDPAATLVRCSNPTCGRVIFLEHQMSDV